MLQRSAATLAALMWLPAPVRAADVATTPWKFGNPFCNVLAAVAPFADGSAYALELFAADGNVVDAHVTLIGDADAYDAHVDRAALTGAPEDRETGGLLVKSPGTLRYFFVDSYSLDGSAPMTCPSYVFEVGSRLTQSVPEANTIEPQHLQALGTIACGHTYEAPSSGSQIKGIVGAYGQRPLTTEIRVYIDSLGQAVSPKIVKASGVEGVDQTALAAVASHRFHPAQFLCTPVVGEMTIRMDYEP
jgi:TonB family protein